MGIKHIIVMIIFSVLTRFIVGKCLCKYYYKDNKEDLKKCNNGIEITIISVFITLTITEFFAKEHILPLI
jgi:hypothetical protein